jgi:hypothetical protein
MPALLKAQSRRPQRSTAAWIKPLDLIGLAHVSLDEEGLASGFAHQADGFLAFCLAAGAEGDVRSFTRERECRGAADAGTASSDHGDFSSEQRVHTFCPFHLPRRNMKNASTAKVE